MGRKRTDGGKRNRGCRLVAWGTALLLGVLLAGCNREDPASSPQTSEPALRIGLIPEQNIFEQVRRYEPVAVYLSGKIGERIELKVLRRYGNIITNFKEGNLDGAFFGSFTYALAQARLGLRVLARPLAEDGTSTYHGLLITRADSGIRAVTDMKGHTFAFVDKATTAGYLFPLAYFKEHGVADYRSFLGETYFAGTHLGVLQDVLAGRVALGAMKNTVFERAVAEDPEIPSNVAILARSPDVPENGLAVRMGLDPRLTEGLEQALLQMHETEEGRTILKAFGAQKFIATRSQDYEPVVRYAKEAGIDLATYDYLNE